LIMNIIKKILIRSGVLNISKEEVLALVRFRDTKSLIDFSLHGSVKSRRATIRGFERIGFLNKKSRSHLIYLMKDKDLSIAILAKEVLESRLMPGELESDPNYMEGNRLIKDKEKYLESRIEYFKSISETTSSLKKSRSGPKRLNQDVSPSQYGQPKW
jgi:hypothetical protein